MNRENKSTLTQNEAMTTEELIQSVASDFTGQYTDSDLNALKEKDASELKSHIEAVVVNTLKFASILPGRPSRPSKPTV